MAVQANYQDALAQLRDAGLIVDELQLNTTKPVRCRVEGRDKEKRGWYRLTDWHSPWGELLIVGAYGVFEGPHTAINKIELPKSDGTKRREITDEQRDALKRRITEDRKRIMQMREQEARAAAEVAAKAWAKCTENGESDYLVRKCIGAHGVRFSPSGALAVPMLDTSGKIHGLQIIRSRKAAKTGLPEKQYWPVGVVTKGHFHLIGSPQWILLLCEGYATGATLFEATGYPVAIAFDAGNLVAVAAELRKRYKRVQILICADDDVLRKCKHCRERLVLVPGVPPICTACGKEHRQDNVGVIAASTAAVEVGGSFLVPEFPDPAARAQLFLERGVKLNDFNDLHVLREGGGLHVVRTQVEARILELGLRAKQFSNATIHDAGDGGKPALRPIGTVDELHRRFALVYGQGGAVFDRNEHMLVSLKDMSDVCTNKYIHRTWMESHDRAIVRIEEVGFDPGNEDPKITCNLWGGWPTRPASGRCEKLLELLRHMCHGDEQPDRLYRWMLCWVAYPIKHPGAKMKTTVVLHSPQGTGKNLFFEAVMGIYGAYGRVIGQDAMEDKFNDWASRKLFLIADEVVARSDAYHIKNKLKAFITGDWIRINPKNIAAYDERNHVNIVFLSNENVPVVLEEDDRRHTVIWTPTKLTKEFYAEVKAEIEAGGIAALHDYLLNYDTGDFHTATEPVETAAKKELINQSMDSTSRFIYAVWNGEVGNVPSTPTLTQEFYDLYKFWCVRVGERAAPLKRLENVLSRKFNVPKVKKRFMDQAGVSRNPQAFYLFHFDVPPAQTEASWLGECVDAFRDAVKQYRGTACD